MGIRTYLFGVIGILLANSELAAAESTVWSFPQSVTVSGSATVTGGEGTATYAVALSGASMKGSPLGNVSGSVTGRAVGTYSVNITTEDGLGDCSDSGAINTDLLVSFGGADPWVSYFTITQDESSSDYPCLLGPLDVLQAVHGAIASCGGTSAVARPLAEFDDPLLAIDQVESGSCGSITEHAVIYNEPQDDAAAPIDAGAPLIGADVAGPVRWSKMRSRAITTNVEVGGAGEVVVTVRAGNKRLGVGKATALEAGNLKVSVPLNASSLRKLLASRATLSLTAFVAGGSEGIVTRFKVKR